MTTTQQHFLKLGLGFAFALLPFASQAGFVTYEAAISINSTVDSFRTDLGALNPNNGSHQAAGRREINWDGVPDNLADPNAFPGNFFNSTSVPGRSRGALFTTPGIGNGFLVSANAGNPTATPIGFGYPVDFVPFSPQRLFTPINSVITDVTFFVPGTNIPAFVGGFGAVFNDVEFADFSKIEFFDLLGNSIYSRSVLTSGNGGLSFLGALANAGEQIGRVRITSGDAPLLADKTYGPGQDGVVMDDFIYAEPQAAVVPAPATAVLFGMTWLVWRKRKVAVTSV